MAQNLWGKTPSPGRKLGKGRIMMDQAARHVESDTPLLRAGKNTIEIIANTAASSERNPDGFLAAMRLSYTDGTRKVIGSDRTWSASRDEAKWSTAKELGLGTMAPWNLKVSAGAAKVPELYPDYATTAAVLRQMDVPPDFHSDGSIRHGHRRTEAADIYFVANTTNENIDTSCAFRVPAGTPQLWDPVTAEIRALPQFTRQKMATSVPMAFEPHQSFFVVFPRDGSSVPATEGTEGTEGNFPRTIPISPLESPWEVAFDPKWGGPAKVTFDQLQDRTTRDERGINYYSGIATYRKLFEFPQESGARNQESGQRIHLDLGTVHDMARVRLNGHDLGVIWCAPWRVDVSDAIKPGENQLEIEVANRWPNRLLGDQSAPDKDVSGIGPPGPHGRTTPPTDPDERN